MRKLPALLAGLVMAASGVLVASPAAAAPRADVAPAAWTDCPANMFCFWTHQNYTGIMEAFPRNWSGVLNGERAYLNNNAESVVNNTSLDVYMYDGTRIGVGAWSYIAPRTRKWHLGAWLNRPSSLANA